MKKQKIKKFFKKHISFVLISFFVIGAVFGTVFGAYTSFLISPQIATGIGSNNSKISFEGPAALTGAYINDASNSAIINNYFEGYYFDSLFGFFKLDWSTNKFENVRIIDSTGKCSTGYGYKLGGKAYSENGGFIDFNYDSNTFVYYCLDDGKLHGDAFSSYVGYQSFEGIQISLVNSVTDLTEKVNNDTIFENDTTLINESTSNNPSGQATLGGDLPQIEATKESIFYIVK